MIPACFFPPSFQRLSLVLGGREEMEGYPEAPGVFAEAQIEPPAEGVFPGPLAAGIRQDTPRGCLRRLAAADFDPARALVGVGGRGPAGGFRRWLEETAPRRGPRPPRGWGTHPPRSPPLPPRRGDRARAAPGSAGDGRPAPVQPAPPFGEGRDFVALLFRC